MMVHRFDRNRQQIEDDDALGRSPRFTSGWWILPMLALSLLTGGAIWWWW